MRGIEQRVLKTNLELDSLSQSNLREARMREAERENTRELEEKKKEEIEMQRKLEQAEVSRMQHLQEIMQNLME